jgi:hypothetical protein
MSTETTTLQEEKLVKQGVIQSIPPSHILQDGRFIYLPEPTDHERSVFLQRSIARHNLLNGEASVEDEEKQKEKREEATEPTIHPLAVASARLQANGIAELSKAINLSGLVNSGEYFGLSNIVNPSLLEVSTKDAPQKVVAHEEEILKSTFLGRRKRSQFIMAEETLTRHAQRLAASVAAQQVVDHRLTELRPLWRLVAPEHGTRAKPHPVKPTEVVAIDVDVYDRDRTGGGVQSAHQGIARKVPRYSTIELPQTFQVNHDVEIWKKRFDSSTPGDAGQKRDTESESLPTATMACEINEPPGPRTKAEPFAVLDPTLGKLDVDMFDPDKVPMLTLQLDIEKDSTGFCQSACLEAMSTGAAKDEKVVVALQHSLFCASLFESIRAELANHKIVWLSTAMETNYLPPPNVMAGGSGIGGRGALCVIHCHEGEVKVQLDSEYALTVKLVEASNRDNVTESPPQDSALSGSQSPAQLHALCRALLLHAQDVYHKHCIASGAKKQVKLEKTGGHFLKSKEEGPVPARILQSSVGLGAKLILDANVRLALKRTKAWLLQRGVVMTVDWLALSLFDLHSHFCLTCVGLTMDVSMERDVMSVSRFGEHGEYRRVEFYSHREFEIYLRMELQKRIQLGSSH